MQLFGFANWVSVYCHYLKMVMETGSCEKLVVLKMEIQMFNVFHLGLFRAGNI